MVQLQSFLRKKERLFLINYRFILSRQIFQINSPVCMFVETSCFEDKCTKFVNIITMFWLIFQIHSSDGSIEIYVCTVDRLADIFSERELTFMFAMSSPVRPSVCLCVTLVHPTHAIEIFGNVSMPFRTLAVCRHPGKILRISSQGNPSVGEGG